MYSKRSVPDRLLIGNLQGWLTARSMNVMSPIMERNVVERHCNESTSADGPSSCCQQFASRAVFLKTRTIVIVALLLPEALVTSTRARSSVSAQRMATPAWR